MGTLFEAARSNDAVWATSLLQGGADMEAKDAVGGTALMVAAYCGSVEVAKLLVEAGADTEAKRASGATALMLAAQFGSVEVAKVLVEAGADMEAKTLMGNNAAALALQYNQPTIFALLDPAAALELGKELKQAFEQATLVHVISTRCERDDMQRPPHVQIDKYGHALSCDPFKSAQEVKRALERAGVTVLRQEGQGDEEGQGDAEGQGDEQGRARLATCVFDPNGDNAFLMGGQCESASADVIRLNNWRWALERVRQTGGCCVQVVVKPGLSLMQEVEAEMAADKGVRVVRLDCSDVIQSVNLEARVDGFVFQAAYERDLVQMPGWAELTALAQQAADGSIPKPLSRQELETLVSNQETLVSNQGGLVSELEEENTELRTKLGMGPRGQRERKATFLSRFTSERPSRAAVTSGGVRV